MELLASESGLFFDTEVGKMIKLVSTTAALCLADTGKMLDTFEPAGADQTDDDLTRVERVVDLANHALDLARMVIDLLEDLEVIEFPRDSGFFKPEPTE